MCDALNAYLFKKLIDIRKPGRYFTNNSPGMESGKMWPKTVKNKMCVKGWNKFGINQRLRKIM